MKSKLLLFAVATLSFIIFQSQYLYCDEPVTSVTTVEKVETKKPIPPIDEVFKQNYVDLTNWVKQSAEQTGEIVNKTGKFAAEQTPLFIQDYIRWQIWGNFVSFFFWNGILILGLILGFKYIKRENNKKDINGKDIAWKDFSTEILKVIISFSIAFICFCRFVFLNGFGDLNAGIKALVAPRVVIVEKIAELIKSK